MKYAFIMNSRSLTPETFSLSYEEQGNVYYFAAVHGMKMTRELALKLVQQEFKIIDLCGNYNAEKAADVRNAAEGLLEVSYAKYSQEDQARFEALTVSDKYGIIVLGFESAQEKDPSESLMRLELQSEEYNTYIAIAATEELAAQAAQDMAAEGIHFIELCGYFDEEKAGEIADAVEHKIPIGYCG
ncbi:hypothetical protein FRZ06_14395 [Anoxybacterium hadale]|uniref:Uncharacterized protein n=1 Tax=Anoxybacterium hadale TaxID=3408580 RepID=A0ACD1ADH2_9FIRM|nr:hypothetical protein FRZ06_14395 [Clostridiales bacterium]